MIRFSSLTTLFLAIVICIFYACHGPEQRVASNSPGTDGDSDGDGDSGADGDSDSGADGDSDGDSDGDNDGGLDPGTVDSSYIWIANTAGSTLSKVDTVTAKEVARYKACPLDKCDPSRTSVNLHGDMVVTNRDTNPSSITKFAGDKTECVDRNGNGTIETSSGSADILPWGKDECMIWNTPLSGNLGARATAWDGKEDPYTGLGGHVWVGTCLEETDVQATVYKINGDTGEIMKQVKIPTPCAYGGAIGPDGGFWIIAGMKGLGSLIRVDTETLKSDSYEISCGYGISIDSLGRIWSGGLNKKNSNPPNCVSVFDPVTNKEIKVDVPAAEFLRGIAVGTGKSKGFVWATDTGGKLFKLTENPPSLAADFEIVSDDNAYMIGVAVDYLGYVWTVDGTTNATYKFDPNDETFAKVPIGEGPYTYSDMTGVQLKIVAPVE